MEEVINHEEENRVRDSKKVIEDESHIGIERLVERLLNFKWFGSRMVLKSLKNIPRKDSEKNISVIILCIISYKIILVNWEPVENLEVYKQL